MAKQQKGGKSMPISGTYQYGSATGHPASTGKIKYGSDLRSGGKK